MRHGDELVLPLRSVGNLKGTRTKALTGACSTPDAYDDLNPQFSRIVAHFALCSGRILELVGYPLADVVGAQYGWSS